MTKQTEKFRALFLSALMVLSVFAGGIALSGSAAAANAADGFDGSDVYDDSDKLLSSGESAWSGQDVYFYQNDSDDYLTDTDEIGLYEVNSDRDGVIVPSEKDFTLSENTDYLLDTTRYDTGEYVISNGSAAFVLQNGEITNTVEATNGSVTDASFSIRVQDLTTEFVDSDGDAVDEVEDSGDDAEEYINIESNRASFDLNVTADGLDEDELQDIFTRGHDGNDPFDNSFVNDDDELVLEGVNDNDYPVNFTDIDAGDYEIDFEVEDTEVTDSASISVAETDDGSVNLDTTSVDVAQGGVAEIQLDFTETSTGYLKIGDADDDGFQINATVDDDDDEQVTVYFNTYKASKLAADGQTDVTNQGVLWADTEEEDDEVTEVLINESVGSILDSSDYELATHADSYEDANDAPDDLGSLYVNEPSVNLVNTWVASSSNIDDVGELSELQTAIEDGEVTESNSVAVGDLLEGANGDVLVTQVDASGLDGMMRTAESDYDQEEGTISFEKNLTDYNDSGATGGYEAAATNGYSLWLEEQDPGANQDEAFFNFSNNDIEDVYYDGEGNYYVVAETGNIVGNEEGEFEDDDTVTVEFALKDEFLLDYDEGDWEDDDSDNFRTATTNLTLEEPEVNFDMEEVDDTDYVTVAAASGEVISGTTNIAPGSEIDVRATGDDENGFVKQMRDVVVQADGTFSAEYDFSDRTAGEEFTARAYGATLGAIDTDDQEEDGLIVEAEPEPTPTPTPEPTTDEPTTDEPTTDEPTTDEPTTEATTEPPADTTTDAGDGDGPGFGIAVALVALLGAALLAVRRNN